MMFILQVILGPRLSTFQAVEVHLSKCFVSLFKMSVTSWPQGDLNKILCVKDRTAFISLSAPALH